MPTRHFPNWLAAYTEFTRYSEAPTAMHFWVGVSTIAGALRRRVWIDELEFQVAPNFYIILVAPAGVAVKSTTIRIGMRLLREVPGVKFGPDSLTWQALGEALEAAREYVPTDPEAPLEDRQFEPMSCITCSPKELGTLLDPKDRKMVDVFVSLWDAQKEVFIHSTRTQEDISVENPWLNVVTATTPAWLRANMPGDMMGGGLASRVVFVYADHKSKLVAYPSRTRRREDHEEMERKLVEDLTIIGSRFGQYQFTEEAYDWGEAWYNDFWTNTPQHLASDRYQGYVARKQTHVHKLAMILASAKRDDLWLHPEDLQESVAIITRLERDMLSVFQSIGVSNTSRWLTEVLAYLRVYKNLPKRELYEYCASVLEPQQFAEALSAGAMMGYVRVVNHGQGDVCEITDSGLSLGRKGNGSGV